jgi:hypothetical protein
MADQPDDAASRAAFDVRAEALAQNFRDAVAALDELAAGSRWARPGLVRAAELTRSALARSAQLDWHDHGADLRHQVRGMLNAIFGWAHILRLKGDDEATVLRGVEVVERNAKALAD